MLNNRRYGKMKLKASLATRGGKNVGVYRKKNGKYVVSIYTGERYPSGRKKYRREEFNTKKEATQRYEELTKNSQQMKQVIPIDSKKTNNKPSKV